MPRLTEQEQQEIIRFIETDKPLSDKYRFLLFEDKREEDTVFCIDEPEAHMSPRLQRKLLEELFRLVGDDSQLWIATHAIGMMRKALQLYEQHKEQVVFLDFTDGKFDESDVIEPAKPNRRFWEQTHEVALDDLGAFSLPTGFLSKPGLTQI